MGGLQRTYVIPWCMMEFLRVLQIIRSVHCTITIDMKNAVWHVYSSTFRWAYVYTHTMSHMWQSASYSNRPQEIHHEMRIPERDILLPTIYQSINLSRFLAWLKYWLLRRPTVTPQEIHHEMRIPERDVTCIVLCVYLLMLIDRYPLKRNQSH